ncbi:MAG: hypothetical protein ACPG5T_03255 [Endozoicomonas sp.]
MKRIIIALLLFWSVPVLANPLLFGDWCETLDQGETCVSYEYFSADGRVSAKGVDPTNTDVGFEMRGTYIINQNIICIITEYERHFDINTGSDIEIDDPPELCLKIKLLSEEQFIYTLPNGIVGTMRRLDSLAPN